jgi:hypothetical protein
LFQEGKNVETGPSTTTAHFVVHDSDTQKLLNDKASYLSIEKKGHVTQSAKSNEGAMYGFNTIW